MMSSFRMFDCLCLVTLVVLGFLRPSQPYSLGRLDLSSPLRFSHMSIRSSLRRSWAHTLHASNDWNEDLDQERLPLTSAASELGEFNPSKKIPIKREVVVGDPQQRLLKEKEISVTAILKELAAIQAQGPQKYCILGSRHCSFLHQQIVELLSYALVLSENHVYTSGAGGTNAAAIRGALRAERPDLLTVILPQSFAKQSRESQDLLKGVTDLVTMPQNDNLSLDLASRICNSRLLGEADQLIAFAFHDSTTVIEAANEAKSLDMLVTVLFLD